MAFLNSQTDSLLTSILEGSSEPICALDVDFCLIASNKAHRDEFERTFGVVPELGENLIEALDHLPEDQARARDVWRRALAGEEFQVTAEFGMADHARTLYELTFRPIHDDGRQIGAVQFARDVSVAHATNAERRRSEERFRQLADAMPQLVWSADAQGVVDYYNERAKEYSGIDRGPADVWEWAPTVHPDDRQATVDAWNAAVESGEFYQIEHRVKMKAGDYRWHLSRGMPARDKHGDLIRWYGTATDIEQTKRAEVELRQADHRKNEFLAMLGHELRNPLAAIANGIRVVARGGEQGRRALPMVQRHVDQMARLLDDLLDISRITRGKLRVERRVRALRPVVAAAVNAVRPWIDQFDHTLDVRPVPDVAVNADATRLEQVISNLLDNAATYTAPGGLIEVWVDVGKDTVSVHVRDNGRGIEPADKESIFEPFTQSDSGKGRGLGIGLALVRKLVALHDGVIDVHSEGLGEGSEFVVELPRAPQELVDHSEQTTRGAPRLDGLRVLAIDDNVDASSFMALLLGDAGCEVETAVTGKEGLELAGDDNFDVVLLDIGLPDMSGRDVARALRERPGYADARLVAVSGYNQDSDVIASEEAGFDAHLGKPVSPETLQAAIAGQDSRHGNVRRHRWPSGVGALSESKSVDEELMALVRQLAHDIRSPLTSVEFSGTLLAHNDDPRMRDVGARLLRASKSIARLTDEACELAGVEIYREGALQCTPCSVEELAEALSEEFAKRHLDPVHVTFGPMGSSVGLWDRRRVQSAVAELAEAAANTSSAAPTVRIDDAEDSVQVELDLCTEVPALDAVRKEWRNFDSLHMKLRFADALMRAHGGNLGLDHDGDHSKVRLWLPHQGRTRRRPDERKN